MVRKAGLLILGIAAAALTGCSKNNSPTTDPGTTTDQTDVQSTIAWAPEVTSDGLFSSGDPAGFSSRGAVGPLSGIDDGGGTEGGGQVHLDHHWWREISNVTTHLDVELSGTGDRPNAAHVTVNRHLTGTFNIAWDDTVPGSPDPVITHHREQKPLKDYWVRQLWLARLGDPAEPIRHGWRLIAASGVNVTSETGDPGTQPVIHDIHVQATGVDTTFADPAAAITWHKLLILPYGTPITMTVSTDAPDDIVVLMHHDGRLLLTANGDNSYTGTWNAPGVVGLKHFGVNALSHGTLYDTDGGYHSHAKLFPFLRVGEAYGS